MIKRLIRKLIGQPKGRAAKFHRIPKSEHGIHPGQISKCARNVTETLQERGFQAYVVGGAVRDLLLDINPKDFDVVTDATPEEVKRLFRRSRIIGRRFRLVHVYCGRDLVEVSTFRASQSEEKKTQDRRGRILRDNTFGSIDEDAYRRDFSSNALFYDPGNGFILDFCGGYKDLERKSLRMIGVPSKRYREDPVRMLRAVRLSEKLGLRLEAKTSAPIKKMTGLLSGVPTARLYDEFIKILKSGCSERAVKALVRYGMHHALFPKLARIAEDGEDGAFLRAVFSQTDRRIANGKSVSPAFIFAAILWPDVRAMWDHAPGESRIVAKLARAVDEICNQTSKSFIPKRLLLDLREIWLLQGRMLSMSGKRSISILQHSRFRAGYDFLELRAKSGEVQTEVVEWWKLFQEVPQGDRFEWLKVHERKVQVPRRRRTRRVKKTNSHRER